MRWAAAWAESVVDDRALERVREAMGLSDVEARDRVQVAIGSCVGGGGTLVGWRPLGVVIWYVRSSIGGTGNSEVLLCGAGGGRGAGAGRLVGGGGDTLGYWRGGTLGGGC